MTRLAFVSRVAIAPLIFGALSCRSAAADRVIGVVALEYAFQAPDTVAPGPAIIRLSNTGKVAHEMILMQLKPGSAVADLVAAQRRDESFRQFVDGGNAVLFADPSSADEARLYVDFEPDRDYVLWCNFRDAEGTPQHAMLGMFKQITVRSNAGSEAGRAVPALHDVTVVTTDYAFQLPDTLPAGATNFRMRNAGQMRHEVAIGLLKAGVTAKQLLDAEIKGSDVDPFFEGGDALLSAHAGEDNELALRFDLLAGRTYVLLCEFQDAPDRPRHVQLGMFKAFAVR